MTLKIRKNDYNLLQTGEGLSVIVSDFVSADHRWLRAPDGTNVQVILKLGKGWLLYQCLLSETS